MVQLLTAGVSIRWTSQTQWNTNTMKHCEPCTGFLRAWTSILKPCGIMEDSHMDWCHTELSTGNLMLWDAFLFCSSSSSSLLFSSISRSSMWINQTEHFMQSHVSCHPKTTQYLKVTSKTCNTNFETRRSALSECLSLWLASASVQRGNLQIVAWPLRLK